jgi:PAS domain S-box-containing protein
LGGIGSPSGVRKPSRRSTAFFSLGLKPRMPSRASAAFICHKVGTKGFAGRLNGVRSRRVRDKRTIENLPTDRRLELLVEAVVDYALYLLNPQGRIVSWNPGASRLKGYEAEEIIGRDFAAFFSPEDRERGIPQIALSTAAKTGRFESEGWRVRKDGSRFWARSARRHSRAKRRTARFH